MCDGVTQGTPGMELSLFSRDDRHGYGRGVIHDVLTARFMLGCVRQDRAGLADRCAALWPLCPRCLCPQALMGRACRTDDKGQGARAVRARSAGRDELLEAEARRLPRPGAPARLRQSPTATRCCWKSWACMCRHGVRERPAPSAARGTSRARRCAPCSTSAGGKRATPSAWWTSAASSTPWWPCWPGGSTNHPSTGWRFARRGHPDRLTTLPCLAVVPLLARVSPQ